MSPPTLLRLAQEACIANIKRLDDFGEAPYHILRPILLKVENPWQLRTIEENSPQICGVDAEVWQNLIRRDIPNWRTKNTEPRSSEDMYTVYLRLRREADEEVHEQEATLKAALNQKVAEKQSQQMTFINKLVDPRKKAPNQSRQFSRGATTYGVPYKAGSGKKAATGKRILDKVRKEAREASIFSARDKFLPGPSNSFATPKPQSLLAQHGQKINSHHSNPTPIPNKATVHQLGNHAYGTASLHSHPDNLTTTSIPQTATTCGSDATTPPNVIRDSPMRPLPSNGKIKKRPPVNIFMPKRRRLV